MKGSGWLPLGQLRTAVTQLKKLESCLCCHDTEHLVAFTLHSVQLYGFVCCRSRHEPCFVGLLFWWFMVWHTSYPCELIWTFFLHPRIIFPRFSAQGVPRKARHCHHCKLHQQEHDCRGQSWGDQRGGLHLQPEVFSRPQRSHRSVAALFKVIGQKHTVQNV